MIGNPCGVRTAERCHCLSVAALDLYQANTGQRGTKKRSAVDPGECAAAQKQDDKHHKHPLFRFLILLLN